MPVLIGPSWGLVGGGIGKEIGRFLAVCLAGVLACLGLYGRARRLVGVFGSRDQVSGSGLGFSDEKSVRKILAVVACVELSRLRCKESLHGFRAVD